MRNVKAYDNKAYKAGTAKESKQRRGGVAQWKTKILNGIEKIINSNIGAGKPKPEFELVGDGLRVTFYSDASADNNITVNTTVNTTVNRTQRKILDLMAVNPKITAEALSAKIGITTRNIKSNIKKLRDAGLVDRVGADKNGDWIVKEDV